MYSFKRDEIIVLLGAGASFEAGVPHSAHMIDEVEKLISSGDTDWSKFQELYYFIRSSIYFSEGIRGSFGDKVSYNIERLVNTLDELRKRNEHTLYPFVGSWSPTLIEVAGPQFKLVSALRDAIVSKLRTKWLSLRDYNEAAYYTALLDFQKQFQQPLRVFTLNYDLCIEKTCNCRNDIEIERGFDANRKWDWRLFDPTIEEAKNIYLYKLHG